MSNILIDFCGFGQVNMEVEARDSPLCGDPSVEAPPALCALPTTWPASLTAQSTACSMCEEASVRPHPQLGVIAEVLGLLKVNPSMWQL